jgi:hypothetical protein
MFLLQRNAIFGKNENAFNNFTRLEQSLENGLIWGRGLSNNFGTYADLFQFKQNGELLTADYTGTLKRHINSNAEIHKGATVIDNDGNIKTNGSNLILASGTIQRRANVDCNVGFQVSPSGFLTMGNLIITPEGVLTSSSEATFSNLTVSNLNAVSITSINITESNLFISNVVADALSGSNIMEGGSNLIEKYALSNALNNMNSNLFTFTSSNFPVILQRHMV